MSSEKKNLWIILIIAAFIVGIGGGILLGSLLKGNSGSGKGMISLYPPAGAQAKGKWLAKIDNYVITQSEFDAILAQIPEEQMAMYGDPAMVKKMLFNQLIDQYVILIEAKKSNVLEDEKTKSTLSAALRQAVYQIYMEKQVKDPSKFTISKVEEEQLYKQYGPTLRERGLNATQIREYLQQEGQKKKFQDWMQQVVNEARDQYKIQKNTELLNKQGLGDAPQGFGMPQGGPQGGMLAPQE